LSSCATASFYQVYNVKPVQETITKSDNLFFEDDNCKITYNLWANGGNIGFNIYNKTDEKIYVNLNESNFILNGFTYDYYKNRTFTTSESKSASTSNTYTGSVAVTDINIYNNVQTNQVKNSSSANISSAFGYSVSIKEEPIISILPKTTKRISEYSINTTLIRNCDLFKYPSKKTIKTKSYSIEQSPIVFSNIITYETKGERITVKNEFFVSGITNYPATEFFEDKSDEYCGQKSMLKTKYFKFYDFDKFYIKYDKGQDYWEH
jgi:hypothetical protein